MYVYVMRLVELIERLTGRKVLDEPENEITITVFRLLVLDLLSLFQVLNQAMINILGKLGTPCCLLFH
jgi:hypothetical protein